MADFDTDRNLKALRAEDFDTNSIADVLSYIATAKGAVVRAAHIIYGSGAATIVLQHLRGGTPITVNSFTVTTRLESLSIHLETGDEIRLRVTTPAVGTVDAVLSIEERSPNN